MEVILHFMYLVAIKATRTWQGASLMELSMVGFWNLIIVWLKVLCLCSPHIPRFLTALQLLLPWRFFRLWALADGLEPIENMVRCMTNNYSAAGFWRGWHRSYNQWLIRWAPLNLVYIPLASNCGSEQVHLHPSWRKRKRDPSHDPCFYLRGSVARFDI